MNKFVALSSIALSLCVVVAIACQAREESGERQPYASSSSSSATLALCRDCPEFVLTPSPPADLRKIRYVSKYELTWKNFLASVDAQACPIPKVEVLTPGSQHSRYVQIEPADFRLDWPITQLRLVDVECYLHWLNSKTQYKVALPSAKEWEWFARAGNSTARFPWGDDDGVGHEQLYGTPFDDADIAAPAKKGFVFPSRRVGRFSPNAWGIHDLMGNVRELTSNVLSSEEWAGKFPSDLPASSKYSRVVLKGSDAWNRHWAKDGINLDFYAIISNGRYSTDVGVRLILIDDEDSR